MINSAPLGGIGFFHLMNDRAMRARGLAGNHCLFALELDGRIDIARLDIRLARAVSELPELRFRLVGRFPRRPRWVIDYARPAPRATRITASSLERALEGRIAERLDGDTPWAVDVVAGAERDALVFRWYHPLIDGKGAERLVRWLGSGTADAPEPPPPEDERFEASERPLRGQDRDARIALMRAYGNDAMARGRAPILSLASVAAARGRGGAMRFRRIVLSSDETRAFDLRVRKQAKLAETSVMLLAATRAVDRALLRRGFAPPQHVVPLPLSLDPKAGSRRLLGNNLTMMLLSLDRDDLDDDARAIARLAEQQREIVRKKLDVGMLAALDFTSFLPAAAFRWIADRPFQGEVASLVCSNPGALSIDAFAGIPVRDAYVMPAPVVPPGFQAIFTRFSGRLSALVGYLDSVVRPEEAASMAEEIKAELCA